MKHKSFKAVFPKWIEFKDPKNGSNFIIHHSVYSTNIRCVRVVKTRDVETVALSVNQLLKRLKKYRARYTVVAEGRPTFVQKSNGLLTEITDEGHVL